MLEEDAREESSKQGWCIQIHNWKAKIKEEHRWLEYLIRRKCYISMMSGKINGNTKGSQREKYVDEMALAEMVQSGTSE